MPDFIFFDPVGHEIGVIRASREEWVVGDVVTRPTGRYRILELIEPNLPDIDGATVYIVEQIGHDE